MGPGFGTILFNGTVYEAVPLEDAARLVYRNKAHPDTKVKGKARNVKFSVKQHGDLEAFALAKRYLMGETFEALTNGSQGNREHPDVPQDPDLSLTELGHINTT